ncbi:MAG: HAMP domain-containing sensor histidine kinase [Deltaproteobacteria bacterium]|nr:HAMP domain-containing sensor histidine kinase [Deltaproteobacteria bacterium]
MKAPESNTGSSVQNGEPDPTTALPQGTEAMWRLALNAQAANGILHNLGNVMTSVSITTDMTVDLVEGSSVSNVRRVVELMRSRQDDLATFLTMDDKGRSVLPFLDRLATTLEDERHELAEELGRLREQLGHARRILNRHQQLSHASGVTEVCRPGEMIEQAIELALPDGTRGDMRVWNDCETATRLVVDRQLVLQILVNLLRNAKDAIHVAEGRVGQIRINAFTTDTGKIQFEVSDNGAGISPENKQRLFAYRFTTKKGGNGLGLYSSGIAAQELGGRLTCTSPPGNDGATFVLELPVVLSEGQL